MTEDTPFIGQPAGIWELRAEATLSDGTRVEKVARYRGDPNRDDAELIDGDEDLRYGFTVNSDSGGQAIDTSRPALTIDRVE